MVETFTRALSLQGLDLDSLRSSIDALVLFGSRASGCARAGSDWDVLCIGSRDMPSPRRSGVDWVTLDASNIMTDVWLGGDLAGHVLAYGIWLHGQPAWKLSDVNFDLAATRKRARIARAQSGLSKAWSLLDDVHRGRHVKRLRRDVQRLGYLERKEPVPPSAVLDRSFEEQRDRDLTLNDLTSLVSDFG